MIPIPSFCLSEYGKTRRITCLSKNMDNLFFALQITRGRFTRSNISCKIITYIYIVGKMRRDYDLPSKEYRDEKG